MPDKCLGIFIIPVINTGIYFFFRVVYTFVSNPEMTILRYMISFFFLLLVRIMG